MNVDARTGGWFIFAMLFATAAVFQCASVVLATGVKQDGDLFFATVAPLTPFPLSPVFARTSGGGFGALTHAGCVRGRVGWYRIDLRRSGRLSIDGFQALYATIF